MDTRHDTNIKLYCSFCGKSQHEVKKLFAGSTTFICDECIGLCIDLLVKDGLLVGWNADLAAYANQAILVRLEQISVSSIAGLLREGGLEKTKGPYNARELFTAFLSATEKHLQAQSAEERLAAEAKRLQEEIDTIASEANRRLEDDLAPLRQKLAELQRPTG